MLTLLFVVSLIFMMIFIISCINNDSSDGAIVGAIIFCVATFFLLIAVCYQSYQVFCRANTISAQIQMYEEENKKIEGIIHSTVKNYMEYEKTTYKALKTEEAIAIIESNKYPALNASDLVKDELKTYKDNNAKLIKLKEEQIVNIPMAKFLLYFGN
jgi:dolichyl-phosphate-mannose--protein O-mannosyl transferase